MSAIEQEDTERDEATERLELVRARARQLPGPDALRRAAGRAAAEGRPPEDPLVGHVLASYRLDRLIGVGSAARVYAAEHQVLRRRYAVKVLHAHAELIPEALQRFTREARSLGRPLHPNVVEVLDYGLAPGGRPFFVMELLSGETLREKLDQAPLPLPLALELARQIALGLAAVHRAGLVHRDLKPENVMLTQGTAGVQVKILDFGLARGADPGEPDLTRRDVILGTPQYMAPEQVLAAAKAGPAADLYALGVLLYEMLAGHAPFRGNVYEVLEQQLGRLAPPLERALDPELEALLLALLDKDPLRRPGPAAEVAQELERHLRGLATPVAAPRSASAETTLDLAASAAPPRGPSGETALDRTGAEPPPRAPSGATSPDVPAGRTPRPQRSSDGPRQSPTPAGAVSPRIDTTWLAPAGPGERAPPAGAPPAAVRVRLERPDARLRHLAAGMGLLGLALTLLALWSVQRHEAPVVVSPGPSVSARLPAP